VRDTDSLVENFLEYHFASTFYLLFNKPEQTKTCIVISDSADVSDYCIIVLNLVK